MASRAGAVPKDPAAEFSYILDRFGEDALVKAGPRMARAEVQAIAEGRQEIRPVFHDRLHRSFTARLNNPQITSRPEATQVKNIFRNGYSYLLSGDPRAKDLGSRRISGTSPDPEYVENYLGRSNLVDPGSGEVNPIVYVTTDENGDMEVWIADETP